MYERVGTWPLAWRQHVFDKAFGLDPHGVIPVPSQDALSSC